MNILSKLKYTATSLAFVASIAAATGQAAAATGQVTAAYRVSDLTTNSGFTNPATANACDTLQYRLRLWNPGAGSLSNVKVELRVPTNSSKSNVSTAQITADNADPAIVSVQTTVNFANPQTITPISGSAQLLDSNTHAVSSLSDSIFSLSGGGGLNIGNLNDSQLEFVQFRAKVNCPTPETPAFSCTALGLTTSDNRKVTVSKFQTATSGGATFKNVDISWGDKSVNQNFTNAVGQTHTFGADGSYTVVATPHFDVNGQDKTATSTACEQVVTFTSGHPTPPPTTLVNTGAGNVFGLFAAASAFGALGYRWILGRRLSREG